jgi:hypothetical protein
MLGIDTIQQYVQKLPRPLQAEVLDFVEYLLSKMERETAQQDETDWSGLSLALAMRGMEREDTPTYTTADLKVVFS